LPGAPQAAVDRRLVIGSVLFGVGWGLSGFCPGPALLTLATLNRPGIAFVALMLVGVFLHAQIFRASGRT
jgi:uncharacterized membrane protein YedE/YeeE